MTKLFTPAPQEEFSLTDILEISHIVQSKFDDIMRICSSLAAVSERTDPLYSSRIFRLTLSLGPKAIELCVKRQKFFNPELGTFSLANAGALLQASTYAGIPRYLYRKSDMPTQEMVTITTWLKGTRLSDALQRASAEMAENGTAGAFIAALHRYARYLSYSGFSHRAICEDNILVEKNEPYFVDFTYSCPTDRSALFIPPNAAYQNDMLAVRRIEKILVNNILFIGKAGIHARVEDGAIAELMKRNGTDLSMFYSSSLWAVITKLKHTAPDMLERIVFSGSSVLCALGLRQNRDIDAIHFESDLEAYDSHIKSHNYQLRYMGFEHPGEIILNPQNYFVVEGAKILSPGLLKTLKESRIPFEKRAKDVSDLESLERFLAAS